MKKFFVIGAAALVAVAMTSCKSNESAYKKAYEKAQAQQNAYANQNYGYQTQQQNAVQTTPIQNNAGYTVAPVTTTTPVVDYSNVAVRTEAVTLVNGAGLKNFSVVVGSFGMLSNAQTLQSTLAQKGYAPQIVSATVNGQPYYRVVAATYETKDQAAAKRAEIISQYPGAWLLYQK